MNRRISGVPFTLYRGGTSKGVFLHRDSLPTAREALCAALLDIFGSPDPRQIDGLGGGDKLTSKAAIMGPSTQPDTDIDYLFAQVGIRTAEVDFNLNCGNLTAAVAAYAVHEGYVTAAGERATVRIHNVNTGRIIRASVPLKDGMPLEEGLFSMDGVPGTGAPIDLDFGAAVGAITGKFMPFDEPSTRLDVPGRGVFEVSVIDGPNLIVIVAADDLGMSGIETPAEIDGNTALTDLMQAIRQTVAERVGLGDYWRSRAAPSTPMLVAVQAPREYVAYTTGARVAATDMDLICRQYSTAATSKALAATVSAAMAMACRVPGSIAERYMNKTGNDAVRLGHPCGTITVKCVGGQGSDGFVIETATIQRTAHLIARGEVFLKRPADGGANDAA